MFHVHRATWGDTKPFLCFAHPALTVSGASFQMLKLAVEGRKVAPLPRRDRSLRFGLFRVRSPLLTESLSFSFPGVTEMFHFTPSDFAGLCIHPAMASHD